MSKKIIIEEGVLLQLINEEIGKFQRKLQLEAEKESILRRLNEMTEEDESESLSEGLFSFRNALKDYKEVHADELTKLQKAHKEYSDDYITISKSLAQNAQKEAVSLATKHGIDRADYGVIYKDIMKLIQPTNYDIFKKQQAKGGWGVSDIGSGGASQGLGV